MLFEQLLVDKDRADVILNTQRRILDGLHDRDACGALAFRYGVRWATRHQNAEIGALFFEESLEYDGGRESAFWYLRDLWGTKQNEWERVAKLAEKVASRNPKSPFMLAQAGIVMWRNVGNVMRAHYWFEQLEKVAPAHPALHAFTATVGTVAVS